MIEQEGRHTTMVQLKQEHTTLAKVRLNEEGLLVYVTTVTYT